MKHATNVVGAATLAALLYAGMARGQSSDAALRARAKVPEAEARVIALRQVPTGHVNSSELEEEHGHLIWSFDIARPGSRSISEIQVDAITGKIVAHERESPRQQAAEVKADAQEAKAARAKQAAPATRTP